MTMSDMNELMYNVSEAEKLLERAAGLLAEASGWARTLAYVDGARVSHASDLRLRNLAAVTKRAKADTTTARMYLNSDRALGAAQ